MTEVFLLVILLTSWLDFLPESQEYDVIEFYAGVGRIARLSHGVGYRSAAYDVMYDLGCCAEVSEEHQNRIRKKKTMDLSTPAGFAFLRFAFKSHLFQFLWLNQVISSLLVVWYCDLIVIDMQLPG